MQEAARITRFWDIMQLECLGEGSAVEAGNYYQLLGVSRYASHSALKRAYHARILDTHPDRNPDRALATERTRQIIEAYSVLSDPWDRQRYDATLPVPVESLRPAPHPFHRRRAVVPECVLKAATAAAALLVIAYVVFSVTQALAADQRMVFRPNVSLLQQSMAVREFPLMVDPGMSDCAAWYAATEYQLSLADERLARRLVAAYADAALQAERSGDPERARFFRDNIARTLASIELPFTQATTSL